jgi:hypothetical protein
MVRRGRVEGWWISGAVLVTLGLLGPGARPAGATLRYGPVQISGSVDSQTWVRHRSISEYQFVQNRNTALLRLDYDMFQNGKLIDKYEIPFVKSAKLYALYRGVYDSFYDIRPGGRQVGLTRYDDIVGGPITGNDRGDLNADGTLLSGLYQRLYRRSNLPASRILPSGRNDLAPTPWLSPTFKTLYSQQLAKDTNFNKDKFENRLREAYIDLRLRPLPIGLRLGRQQVIWGESDQFRLMDIWNPLDLTWHVQQEEWDKLRVPLWLVKGIYDLGQVGPLTNSFVEVVWNPGDYQPGAKVDFLPRPWAIPIPNPLRAGQIQLPSTATMNAEGNPVVPQQILLTPIFDLQGTDFQRGKFNRNPIDASDIGTRFHAVTPQGLEFTLNYLYIRGRGIGASAGQPTALKIEDITIPSRLSSNTAFPGTFENLPVLPAEVTAQFIHPYTHIFGLTGNYFEGNWTNTVFRLESAYQMGAPFQTIDPNQRVHVRARREDGTYEENPRPQIAPLGFTKRNIWAGMVGFDRPTWIKWLNARTTWFITGQFFWSYIDGPSSDLRAQVITASEAPYITPQNPSNITVWPSTLTDDGIGQWTSGPYAGLIERTQNQDPTNGALYGNADNVRRWELLSTLAATSFYRGGTLVPFGAMAIDPVNVNLLVQLKLDYFLTNNVIIQLRQNFYTNFGADRPSIDPWGAGGLLARRDETGVKVTYQF